MVQTSDDNQAGEVPIQITWLGHAAVLVQIGYVRILLDPVVRSRVAHLKRRVPVDPAHLTDIDAVCISHAHHDHLDIGSLRLIRTLSPNAAWHAPRGAARVLERAGFRPVIRRHVGDSTDIRGVHVQAVVAQHGGNRSGSRRDEAGAEAVGYVINPSTGRPRVWFAGDTQLDDTLATIAPVDVALVPIGGWWRSLGPGHMDSDDAAQATRLVSARVAIPIHWGTFHPMLLYRLMVDAFTQPAGRFARAMYHVDPAVDVRILEVGGSTIVEAGMGLQP